MNFIYKIRMKVYYHLVEKNPEIKEQYQGYVNANLDYHRRHRIHSWIYMVSLNISYYITNKFNNAASKARHSAKRNSAMPVNAPVFSSRTPNQPKPPAPVPVSKKTAKIYSAEKSNDSNNEPLLLSLAYERPAPHLFVMNLLKYSVISFDIFDTLIFRPLASPIDVFKLVGYRLGIADFLNIRLLADKRAKERNKAIFGNEHINIFDIYEQVELLTGIDREYGANLEFEIELDLCFANPYMKRVYDLLLYQNKRIICISDMHLTSEMINKMLKKCGYHHFEKIYISCEYHSGKRNGNLFKIVSREYSHAEKIMHIGDNFETDIRASRKLGWHARHYKNVNEIGIELHPIVDEMSDLIASAYLGVINSHMHNGLKTYSPFYEYGYTYGGLYILGYCQWIYKFAQEHGTKKILFLSRDGDIYQRVFTMMYPDFPTEYIYWSRIANTKYATAKNQYEFISRMGKTQIASINKVSIRQLFTSSGLEELIPFLQANKLHPDELITPQNLAALELFYHKYWSEIVRIYDKDVANVYSYLYPIIRNHEKIAIVDVGWVGSGPMGLKYLIEDRWNLNCKVDCLLAGSRLSNHAGNIMNTDRPIPYLFSNAFNPTLNKEHFNTNKGMNSAFFEFFTQSCSPTFSGFTKEGNFEFDIPEVEMYQTIKGIHEGIWDFCISYYNHFKKWDLLLNISGYDAYRAFSPVTKNLQFIKAYFSDCVYQPRVCSDGMQFDRLGKMLETKNL
jgi:FMN phosphatase YigB (HAD superfamily)